MVKATTATPGNSLVSPVLYEPSVLLLLVRTIALYERTGPLRSWHLDRQRPTPCYTRRSGLTGNQLDNRVGRNAKRHWIGPRAQVVVNEQDLVTCRQPDDVERERIPFIQKHRRALPEKTKSMPVSSGKLLRPERPWAC